MGKIANIIEICCNLRTTLLKINNNVCPDNKFANKRIERLNGREIYEIISSIVKIGFNTRGKSCGMKNKKNL